tara:strand:+ start:242 stop:1429 length:1188 start_codon:yes stop_codon:yes gene_type:complete
MVKLINSKNNDNSRTIGIVGGGQLAQMLVNAAKAMDIQVVVQTPFKTDPASINTQNIVLASATDVEATKELSTKCNYITFENEWIDIIGLKSINNYEAIFTPSLSSLEPLVDKISQKKLLKELKISLPDWIPINYELICSSTLPTGWNFPLMAKASRGGYDGKGTRVINNFHELKVLYDQYKNNNWFIEKWSSYDKELAVVVSRDKFGKISFFPITETYQSKQVCDWVIAPANVSHQLEVMIKNIAMSILLKLNYVGVIAIEFFYGQDGLKVNEIAPRVHNSAHFSINACHSSQFEHQICITSGLKAPSPDLIAPGVLMINLLGLSKTFSSSIDERLSSIRKYSWANLHWYKKEEEISGRKLGHINVLLTSESFDQRIKDANFYLEKIRNIWPMP